MWKKQVTTVNGFSIFRTLIHKFWRGRWECHSKYIGKLLQHFLSRQCTNRCHLASVPLSDSQEAMVARWHLLNYWMRKKTLNQLFSKESTMFYSTNPFNLSCETKNCGLLRIPCHKSVSLQRVLTEMGCPTLSKFNTAKVTPFWSCYWKFGGLWYSLFYQIFHGCF